MNQNKDPQAAIYIEEEHHYDVDLGVVPIVAWQKAGGSIRVEIPYDGAVLKQDVAEAHQYSIGNLHMANHGSMPDVLPIVIEAGPTWRTNIKSNKKSVITARYKIDEPGDPLISIDGVVLDDALEENEPSSADGIFGNVDAYNNPLALRLSLWVPDLLAETRPSEVYELETMLLRGENTRQVFMASITALNFEQKLAENLAALANTVGGTVLLGADKSGYVVGVPADPETRKYLLMTLLKAALRTSPPVPLWRLSEIRHPSARMVVRIEIPAAGTAIHRLDNAIYRRQGQANNAEVQPAAAATHIAPPVLPESNLEDVFDRDETGTISFRNREEVVVCNGSNGLKHLRLGAYLCGLINAGKRTGRIIITNLPSSRDARFSAWSGTKEDLDKVISNEMAKLLPRLDVPIVERRHLGDQQIAVIHLPTWHLPIALYDGEAYIWQNPALNELKIEELFDKYLQLTGNRGQAFDDQDVYLEQALLESPIRPPEHLDKNASVIVKDRLAYDVEYQAQVWEPRPFMPDEDTVGFSLQLTAPLSHVSLTLSDGGKVTTESPEATGQIRVRLNDVLVSGLEVTPHANNENQWLNAIPIIKRTYLLLNYNARLNELFQRRTKTSLLRFLIPDVLLDRERVDDLAQVCADVGFRVYDKELFDTAPSAPIKATIHGIRGYGYYDIALLVGLLCQQSELTRELHYDGWQDSKSTYTAMLDVRVKLWGTGEHVEKEIGRLQMELYQTISQRLQHLRTE